ncbi:unnamed protein product [Orchesella dallaii]|uniref:DUF4806 domain-containing protein n=1 Tax=Orchesella dallaii TaxID=48710 RepID=A0ABP1RJH3_9HEXA
MELDTHAIVCFEEENSIAVVPLSWIKDDVNGLTVCSYPPQGKLSTRGLKKAVKKSENAQDSWPDYNVRVIKTFRKKPVQIISSHNKNSIINGLRKRSQKAIDATVTSDLSDVGTSRRKRFIPPSTLPDHPALFGLVEGHEPPPNATEMESVDVENIEPSTSTYRQIPQDAQVETVPELGSLVAQLVVVDDTEFKSEHIAHGPLHPQPQPGLSQLPHNLLPCKSSDDLDSLEELIFGNVGIREKIKGILAMAGGNSVDESVGLMLSVIMTDDLMRTYNLKGKGKTGKLAFNKYTAVFSVIFDGLLLNPRTQTLTTIPSINESISKSLKRADDRVRQRTYVT